MRKGIVSLFTLLVLSGCMQPTEEDIRQAIAETELAGVYATKTELAKSTSTSTITPTPTLTPTSTKPAVTNTPKPTIDPNLTSDKKAGIWLVGNEIAAGMWRSDGDCMGVTFPKNDPNTFYTLAHGNRAILTVPTYAFTVEFQGKCAWSYIGK